MLHVSSVCRNVDIASPKEEECLEKGVVKDVKKSSAEAKSHKE